MKGFRGHAYAVVAVLCGRVFAIGGTAVAPVEAAFCATNYALYSEADPNRIFDLLRELRLRQYGDRPVTKKNSFVSVKPTVAEKLEIERLRLESRGIEADVWRKTQEHVRNSKKLQELERSGKTREAAELRKKLTYDHVVVGRGHTAIVAVKNILGKDPKARVLIVGEEETFWPLLHFSIAMVGDIPGFFERHGGVRYKHFSEAEYLRQHENQHPGYVLGKYINEHTQDFLKNPNVTILAGKFQGDANGRLSFSPSRYEAEPDFPMFAHSRTAPVFSTGLGAPNALKIRDTTEPGSPEVNGNAFNDVNGYPLVSDNIKTQVLFQEGVTYGKPISTMIKQDMDLAKKNGRKARILVSGFGDGAFSVFEGLLEGIFREHCGNITDPAEQREAWNRALENIEIVWAGKESGAGTLSASLALERYAKIVPILDALQQSGKLRLVANFTGAIEYRGPAGKNAPLWVSFEKGSAEEASGFDRIFHNNGNAGTTDILERMYLASHPGAKEAPQRGALLRAFDWKPAYHDGKLIGIRVLQDGKPRAGFTGNAGLLLALAVAREYASAPPKDGHLGDPARLTELQAPRRS